jgi:hypothetical protein
MKSFALAAIGTIDTRDALASHLSPLSDHRLIELCEQLELISPPQGITTPVSVALKSAAAGDSKESSLWAARQDKAAAAKWAATSGAPQPMVIDEKVVTAMAAGMYPKCYRSREFLYELLITSYERRASQKRNVKELSLYPAEDILFDENLVPSQNYAGTKQPPSCDLTGLCSPTVRSICLLIPCAGEGPLALPKLNLQFLTFHDYLLRNFNLFRLESTYEIREDLALTVERLRPRLSGSGNQTVFTGWSRMAVPIRGFKMREIRKPNIGETVPARVTAEVAVDLTPFQGGIRA